MGAYEHAGSEQLGFSELLAEAAEDNAQVTLERQAAHLPADMKGGTAVYRDLIYRHHAAMIEADCGAVIAMREEAHLLASKLNEFKPGILAHDDAPGYVLARATTALPGEVPLWGQTGRFRLSVCGIEAEIEMQGMLDIGSSSYWLGFAAHAIDPARPFLSETGYRSFIGAGIELEKGIQPDTFARIVMEAFVTKALKKKPVDRRDAVTNGHI